MENEKIGQENYLAKNLKRVILITAVLIVVLIGLYIVDTRINFLSRLARELMTKLMGG